MIWIVGGIVFVVVGLTVSAMFGTPRPLPFTDPLPPERRRRDDRVIDGFDGANVWTLGLDAEHYRGLGGRGLDTPAGNQLASTDSFDPGGGDFGGGGASGDWGGDSGGGGDGGGGD